MTFFQGLRHSLAARVLGVFVVTGVAVLLVITLAWGVAMKHQWNTKIRAHLLQYIDYVNRDIGTPPDPQRADELAQLVPVNIYIKGPNIDYSSTGFPLDLSELEFDDDEHHGPPWRREKMTTAAGVKFAVGDYDERTIIRTRAKVSVELLDESATRTRLEEDLLEMESLVSALIESERLNTRHSALNAEPVEISALLESVIARSFAGQINVDLSPDMPALILDETRLRLLLRNLLSNAVRYSDNAPPSLRARVADNTLTIEVEDSGEGIAAQDIDKLTEPFYRVDPSRTRSTGGFGLGLYLCRLICEAHGGDLLFASSPGVGTTVTATLKSQKRNSRNEGPNSA